MATVAEKMNFVDDFQLLRKSEEKEVKNISSGLSSLESTFNSIAATIKTQTLLEKFEFNESKRIYREISAENTNLEDGTSEVLVPVLSNLVDKLSGLTGTSSKPGILGLLLGGLALGGFAAWEYFSSDDEKTIPPEEPVVPETPDISPPETPATKPGTPAPGQPTPKPKADAPGRGKQQPKPPTPSSKPAKTWKDRALDSLRWNPITGPVIWGLDPARAGYRKAREQSGSAKPSPGIRPSTQPGGASVRDRYNILLKEIGRLEGNRSYNAMNRKTAGDLPGEAKQYLGKNLTDMTIGEVMENQKKRRLLAAGKYQFVPDTLSDVMKVSKLKKSDRFSPENQDTLAIDRIKSYRKRLADYIEGRSNDLHGAQKDLAMEWRAFPDPDTGKTYQDAGSKRGGNKALISNPKTKQLLESVKGSSVSTQQVSSETVMGTNGRLHPSQLKSIGIGDNKLEPNAADAFRRMYEAARSDGVTLQINDSYRTYDEQVAIKKKKTKEGRPQDAATPGTSNHGLGKALDISVGGRGGYSTNKAYKWLVANAHKYGFKGPLNTRSTFEPWHWEFTGSNTIASNQSIGNNITRFSQDVSAGKTQQRLAAIIIDKGSTGSSTTVVAPPGGSISQPIIPSTERYREYFA